MCVNLLYSLYHASSSAVCQYIVCMHLICAYQMFSSILMIMCMAPPLYSPFFCISLSTVYLQHAHMRVRPQQNTAQLGIFLRKYTMPAHLLLIH